MRQQEDMKNSILSQILDQNARARRKWRKSAPEHLTTFNYSPAPLSDAVNTLKLSKPDKAQLVEGQIIRMAQSGQLPGRLNEEQLIQLLESLNSQLPKSTSTVKFDRRRAALDSDDDDDDYGL